MVAGLPGQAGAIAARRARPTGPDCATTPPHTVEERSAQADTSNTRSADPHALAEVLYYTFIVT